MEPGYRPCPYCAEPIREAATVCRYCNRTVAVASPPGGPEEPRIPAPASAELSLPVVAKNPWRAIVSIGVLFTLLLILVLGLLHVLGPVINDRNHRAGSVAPNPLITAVLQPVPISRKLLSGNLVVEASQIKWLNFTVPPNGTNGQVAGTFQVFGGAGNDVQAIITDAFEFENWKNNHQTRVLYNSDRVTNGAISLQNLPPGAYVLAFDNRFSIISRKQVTADITFSYLAH